MKTLFYGMVFAALFAPPFWGVVLFMWVLDNEA